MTSGGLMYHDAGFAGLPETAYPTTVHLSGKESHISASRQREVAHAGGDTLAQSPLSIPRSMLLEEVHTLSNV